MKVVIAPKARGDIASILAWTQQKFGSRTLKRYRKLIETAIAQVAADPELVGSTERPEVARHCRTYHLYFCRNQGGRVGERIRQPRHFLLYRVIEGNIVEIGRVLHDSMDVQDNLPESYRASPE